MRKKILVLFILFTNSLLLFGQQELTLFHMNNVYQGSYVNPSLIPEGKVSIGLPILSSISSSLYFSSFVANDVKQKVGNTEVLNVQNAISKMAPLNNYIYANANIDLFSLRVKVRNLYVSVKRNKC